MADRYTYIPYIGLFLMLAWSVNYWLKLQPAFHIVAPASVSLCWLRAPWSRESNSAIGVTAFQLFQHAVQVTPKNRFCDKNLSFPK